MARRRINPVTFFLNETHELSAEEREGGGRPAKYAPISWTAKAKRISDSLESVRATVEASHDPLKDHRYFAMALPEAKVKKTSTDKKKAPTGFLEEATEYGEQHAKVFERLGLDLLQVTPDGRAIVHADREKFEQLAHRSESLDTLGVREQGRWITIESFEIVPMSLRIDDSWVNSLATNDLADVIFELQPILNRADAETVLRAISDLLTRNASGRLSGTGTDYSGRHWFRGKSKKQTIRQLARDFYSIQAIHPPLFSIALGRSRESPPLIAAPAPANAAQLPCVAVVDMGVPEDHVRLRPYRRGRFYLPELPTNAVGKHGSLVASRVIFGDCRTQDELLTKVGQCSFYDVMVGDWPLSEAGRIDEKRVVPAMVGTRAAAEDVRVFNLSIGHKVAFAEMEGVVKAERRRLTRDLDNFVFANDCIVVVAAGNSQPGIVPETPYPHHYSDIRWGLGPWSLGYNTIVCGSFVSDICIGDFVPNVGWPSPFTRIGPGWNDTPIPSFSAPGGSTAADYRRRNLGVWTISSDGLAEDNSGTSYSAPLLAREAALLFSALQEQCSPGTRPFAVTVRAFLTLTAIQPVEDQEVRTLVERTLGVGQANIQRIREPRSDTAVFLWQGYIESPRDTTRVQLPIPIAWLSEAETPVLRIVICSDPPVNDIPVSWACRQVVVYLRPTPDAKALRRPRGEHASYPTIIREYDLAPYKPGQQDGNKDDMWTLEFSYDEIAPYQAAMDFDPRQRVAFAAELLDRGARPISPQDALQALPIAATMNRLSIQNTPVRSPIILKTRV